ncbi:MAG TPA: hypothetical protein GXX28_12160 [Firmicutes bacterium]|nr:hypothetical protein [Bacillota bacterium]
MGAFVGTLGFLVAGVGLISVIVPLKALKIKTRKAGALVLAAGLALVVVGIGMTPSTPTPQKTATAQSATLSSSSTQNGSATLISAQQATTVSQFDSLRRDMNQRLGKWNLGKADRVQTIATVKAKDGSVALAINLLVNDNLSQKLVQNGALMDMWRILPLSFDRVDGTSATGINLFYPVTDKYGNSKLSRVGMFIMERSEYNKINKQNFLWSNLPQVGAFVWNLSGI